MCLGLLLKVDYLGKRKRNPEKVFHVVDESDRCLLYPHAIIFFKFQYSLTGFQQIFKAKMTSASSDRNL